MYLYNQERARWPVKFEVRTTDLGTDGSRSVSIIMARFVVE